MDIHIIEQNSELIVVDKPTGVSVHNVEEKQNLLTLLESQRQIKKLFPVHRLDKETSGVQIFALNEVSAKNISEYFQTKSVKKIYQGILRGQIKIKEGTWNQALSDKSEGRKNPAGLSKDRINCETKFKVLQQNQYFTFCEFDLITGRQHQIRKHAAINEHAILGDPRYGDPKYNLKMANIYKTDRMFLHCCEIQLNNRIYKSENDFAKIMQHS